MEKITVPHDTSFKMSSRTPNPELAEGEWVKDRLLLPSVGHQDRGADSSLRSE